MSMAEMPETEEMPEKADEAGVSVPARITLFGFDGIAANARIEARSTGWRARRAAIALALGSVLVPAAALVPPHAPWALGALFITLLTARRRWVEKHTLHFLDGACPRCGQDVSISRPTRLRHPHPISCASCHYELAVSVDL